MGPFRRVRGPLRGIRRTVRGVEVRFRAANAFIKRTEKSSGGIAGSCKELGCPSGELKGSFGKAYGL